MKKMLSDILTSGGFFLVLGILLLIGTYFKGKKDGSQIDNIENVSETTKELTTQVKTLVTENTTLIERTNDLISDVRELTKVSQENISTIKALTSKEFAQNAIQGKLNLEFDHALKDEDSVTVIFGTSTTNYVWEWNRTAYIKIDNFEPIRLKIVDKKIVLSLVANDFGGNWLAEIDQNYWRRNQSQISKFNYDSKGFEIMNNKNKVSFSINILPHNTIKIQGIFSYINNGKIFVAHDDTLEWFTFGSQGNIQQNILQQIDNASKIYIKPIFSYTGDSWLGKRAEE